METSALYFLDLIRTGKTICVTRDKDEIIKEIKSIDENYSIKVIISGELVDVYENISEEEFNELL